MRFLFQCTWDRGQGSGCGAPLLSNAAMRSEATIPIPREFRGHGTRYRVQGSKDNGFGMGFIKPIECFLDSHFQYPGG
tara:strand:+ start:7426 stop:7659 length:234 start_codon:yes stop_codon:yes gene_type:complete